MGSLTYDFLADSILFNEDEIENHFSSLKDEQIEKILDDYRNHCLSNYNELTKEIIENKSTLKVLSSIEEIRFDTLKQSALYFDQFIIYDPLFKFTHKKNDTAKIFSQYLGYQYDEKIDRVKLAETVRLLKAITPMIVANYVKILPLSYAFEPPKELPITLPINYYADILPKDLMEYCHSKVIVKSMKQQKDGWRLLETLDYTPGLHITFEDLNANKGITYNYSYLEYKKTNNPKEFEIKMTLADYPLDKNIWDAWVFQSMNSASKKVVDQIYYENLVANDLNTTYLTDNLFTANLLTQNLNATETIETASATQFLNINLPFLDKVDINKLMSIRTYEADIFTNFRIELERQFRELRHISDPKEIKARQENIIHELEQVQVKKINKKLEELKRKGFIDAAILIGGLAGTVQTGGWSLLSSALATVSGYKTYKEYKDSLKENPSYLLWKVLK